MPEPKKILIVEDENDIRKLMALHLGRKGYNIHEAVNGKEAYELLEKDDFDLLVLDWMLPGVNGLELLSWVRGRSQPESLVPILFVTAKSEPENIVKALEAGADDYIIKPFDFRVLMARVSSLLRRREMKYLFETGSAQNKKKFKLDGLVVDSEAHKVFIEEKEISLTLSEFLLLEVLLMNQGKALSRKQLAGYVQGEDISVTSRTIDTHTSILRKKIGKFGKLIETVRGVGYRIGYIQK